MIERMTPRAFRARFHKVTDPVLVGEGIWFPKAEAIHMALAERRLVLEFVAKYHTEDGERVIDEVGSMRIVDPMEA